MGAEYSVNLNELIAWSWIAPLEDIIKIIGENWVWAVY